MASDRTFPPSARRLAVARAAGLTPASPLLVGALGAVGAVLALVAIGGTIASRLGSWVRDALEGADGSRVGRAFDASSTGVNDRAVWASAFGSATDIVHATFALALPMLGTIAIVAVIVHLTQTRALWMPRRRLDNAPAEDLQRGTRGVLGLANAAVITMVTIVWLFAIAPRIATLVTIDRASGVGATGVGATGIGATGVGATGVGATGVGATGVGATGIGPTGATGIGPTGVGATGVGATG
ncbi:MAG: EscU/YscU/HrcU family type III secretion system export apparatus switch protein, partial [Kofleriaceae bacterium]